jgi:uncharacterized protein YlxW (UPF0749 family)
LSAVTIASTPGAALARSDIHRLIRPLAIAGADDIAIGGVRRDVVTLIGVGAVPVVL